MSRCNAVQDAIRRSFIERPARQQATTLRIRRRIAVLSLAAVCAGAQTVLAPTVLAQTTNATSALPAYVPAGQTLRYETEIAAIESAARVSPPPDAGILFVGSSIFRQWADLKTQMAPLPAYNHAFGGSRTWEVLYYMDRVVLPFKPRFIVYYCGSNDVNGKEDATGIVERITQFNDRVHAALPQTRVFFVAIQRAPDKRARWAVVDSVNAALKATAARSSYITYLDLNPVLFDRAGAVRSELYKPDSLHFLPPAYVEFTAVIKPALEKAWAIRR